MRLAVLSDIHGNLTAFEAALADLEAQGGADVTWFLGDFAAFGPRPAECVQRIKAMVDAVGVDSTHDDEQKKHTVRVIRGNTDRYLVYGQRPRIPAAKTAEEFEPLRRYLRDLSEWLVWGLGQLGFDEYDFLHKMGGECDLNAEGYGYVIGYHGTPGDDEGTALMPKTSDEEAEDALLDREGRLGIGGHIHVQMDRTLRSGWRVVNVGSVGSSNDNPGYAQYGIFTFDGGDVQVDLRAVPFDVDAVIEDARALGAPAIEWLAGQFGRA